MSAVAVQSFGFGDSLVRVIDRDGSAWFVANDVCGALEIANPRHAVSRLEDDERDGVVTNDAIGRAQETTIVSESGVYALIFTSRKPSAKAFRKWVTQEVLPAIRTTGRYSVANDEPDFSAPETPDQFDVLRVKLQLVREARHAFGLKGARKAWSHCGLPELMSEPEHELMPIGVLADLHRSIAEWMEARTEAVPGHREWSSDLYDDYVRWCRGQDMSASAIETQVVFGRMLTQCGVAAKRSGRVLRIGLRLVR